MMLVKIPTTKHIVRVFDSLCSCISNQNLFLNTHKKAQIPAGFRQSHRTANIHYVTRPPCYQICTSQIPCARVAQSFYFPNLRLREITPEFISFKSCQNFTMNRPLKHTYAHTQRPSSLPL